MSRLPAGSIAIAALAVAMPFAVPIAAQVELKGPPPTLRDIQARATPTPTPTPALKNVPLQINDRMRLNLPRYAAYQQSAQGTNETSFAIPGGVGAISWFRLSFGNGDHKILRMGLREQDGAMRAALSDGNGGDPFKAEVGGYQFIGMSPVGAVAPSCRGRCSIRLPAHADGMVALLAGFWLERLTPDDANVQNVRVSINPESDAAEVIFLDDGGGGIGLRSGAYPPYRAVVQVVFVPAGLIAARGRVSGNYAPGRELIIEDARDGGPAAIIGDRALKAGGPYVLRGFSFAFGNGDHFLQTMGVLFPKADETASHVFQDSNTDDPHSFWVDYAVLKR